MGTNKPINLLQKTLIFYTALNIILILSICGYTFYWADDYNFMFDISQNGILNNCIIGYFNWDGRFLSFAAFVQAFLLSNFRIEFITFFWCLCFLLSGFFIFKIVQEELKLKIETKLIYFFGSIISLFFWYSAKTHMAQTIYWGTGGVYSFSLLLGAVWCLLYLQLKNIQLKLIQKIYFLIFTFLVGQLTQNMSIALIILVLIDFVIDILKKNNKNNYFNFSIFLFLLIGLTVILIAPGNLKRMNEINNLNLEQLRFQDLIFNFFDIISYYFKSVRYGLYVFIFLIFSLKLFFQKEIGGFYFTIIKPINLKTFIIGFLNKSKWFFVAISTISPLIIMPMMAAERTMIYFNFFIFIFILKLIVGVNSQHKVMFKYQKIVSFLVIFIILTKCFVFSIKNLNKGKVLKKEIFKREQILLNSKNKDVIIKILPEKLKSDCYNFYDLEISADPKYFMKVGYENYFGLRKIIIKK